MIKLKIILLIKILIQRRWTNCIYEIVNNAGEIHLTSTLNEAATILNVDFRTVKRQLESVVGLKEGFVFLKGKRVRRVAVFYPFFEKHNN